MEKVHLYTCQSGVYLFEHGESFGAWTKDAESYKDTEKQEYGNISLFVDKSDIEPSGEENAFRVVNIKSVEIIG